MPLCEIARVLQLPDESCTFWTGLYLLAVIAQKLTRSYSIFLILVIELEVVVWLVWSFKWQRKGTSVQVGRDLERYPMPLKLMFEEFCLSALFGISVCVCRVEVKT